MELRHLRYFVAVAEERNFTRAAERLHIAQPPLSRQIQQLEDDLGVQLFERHSRPLKLTDTGRYFYTHALQLLAQTAELQAMTKRVGKIEHKMSVGFVGSTLYGMLPRIIRRFRQMHADLELSLHEMSTMDQIKALNELQIALGLVAMGEGISVVPSSVYGLKRDDVTYKELDDPKLVSPIIMSTRMMDESADLHSLRDMIYQLYEEEGMAYLPPQKE
ncbi:HTH-type transcriptional regulator HdfR [compost metagenome]